MLRGIISPIERVCIRADLWQFDINFQMGGEDTLIKVSASGEPLVPAFADLMRVYNAKSLSASELIKVGHMSVGLVSQ